MRHAHSDGRQTYGHAMIISPWGEIMAEAENDDGVITATIDVSKITNARRAIPSLNSLAEFGNTKLYRR